MNSKISIIVPVYNVEKYLSKCLDTLIQQYYQNLEILLVNDGSTDSSPEICATYASQDSRIKLIHRENGGLSAARNSGLDVASGDYISFVDSDDFLSLAFYECLLSAAVHGNADIVECAFKKFSADAEVEQINKNCSGISETFSTEDGLKLLMLEKLRQIVWNKLYRRDVIQDLRFPVGRLNEDEYFTYKAFGNSKRIIKIPDVLYFYRQHEASIMGEKYSIKRLDGLIALEQRISYMHAKFPNLENTAIRIFSLGSIWHYQQISNNPQLDPQKTYRKKLTASVRLYSKTSIWSKWTVKQIFWYRFFLLAPDFCVKFRNVFGRQ